MKPVAGFPERLKELMNDANINMSEMAKRIHVSKQSISRYLIGDREPKTDKVAEIAKVFGINPVWLMGYEVDKYLPISSDQADLPRTLRIPVYGCIAAGIPIEEIEDIDDWEEINYPGAVRGEYIALRIKGDSMEPRICEGDVIIIHIQPTVDNGDLAAVRVNDHYTDGVCATCKKVRFTSDGGIMLMSINPAYEPMYFSRKQIREEGVEIIGKVVELRGKLG